MEKDTDKWTTDGSVILSQERISRLRKIIEDESAVIIEHRFYRGGRAPYRFVSDDFDDIEQYLKSKTTPGDSIYFWRFEDCCREDNIEVNGKVPDEFGKVPKRGSY